MILQLLLPYAALFYLIESLILVRHGSFVFEALFGWKFRPRKTGVPIKAFGPVLYAAGLLPSSRVAVVDSPHWIFNEKSLGFLPKGRGVWTCMPYEEVKTLELQGSALLLNGKQVWEAKTIPTAEATLDLLQKLKTASPQKRQKLIKRNIAKTMDLEMLKDRSSMSSSSLEWLSSLSITLFCLCFIVLPISIFRPSPAPLPILITLGAMGASYATILILVYLLHKKFHPQDKYDRFVTMISIILCPPGAMHAVQYLTKNQLDGFDPLAAAGVILETKDFVSLVREKFLFEEYQCIPEEFQVHRKWRMECLLDFAATLGLSKDDFTAQPESVLPNVSSYCPKCLVQYSEGVDVCADCQIPLKSLNRGKN